MNDELIEYRDTWNVIFENLSSKELCSLCLVSKIFHKMIMSSPTLSIKRWALKSSGVALRNDLLRKSHSLLIFPNRPERSMIALCALIENHGPSLLIVNSNNFLYLIEKIYYSGSIDLFSIPHTLQGKAYSEVASKLKYKCKKDDLNSKKGIFETNKIILCYSQTKQIQKILRMFNPSLIIIESPKTSGYLPDSVLPFIDRSTIKWIVSYGNLENINIACFHRFYAGPQLSSITLPKKLIEGIAYFPKRKIFYDPLFLNYTREIEKISKDSNSNEYIETPTRYEAYLDIFPVETIFYNMFSGDPIYPIISSLKGEETIFVGEYYVKDLLKDQGIEVYSPSYFSIINKKNKRVIHIFPSINTYPLIPLNKLLSRGIEVKIIEFNDSISTIKGYFKVILGKEYKERKIRFTKDNLDWIQKAINPSFKEIEEKFII